MADELIPTDSELYLAAQDVLGGMPTPEKVAALEQQLLQMPQARLATTHVVHGGMYARTIYIPAGTILTGALLAHDNICVVMGDIIVTTDQGLRHIVGHNILPARKGFKRAGIAISGTWWTTILATELQDIQEIEDWMTAEAPMLQTRRDGIEYDQAQKLEV